MGGTNIKKTAKKSSKVGKKANTKEVDMDAELNEEQSFGVKLTKKKAEPIEEKEVMTSKKKIVKRKVHKKKTGDDDE